MIPLKDLPAIPTYYKLVKQMSEEDDGTEKSGGKQMANFMIRKGDYLCTLAQTHSQGMEYEKAESLYVQAAGWYKKAGAADKYAQAVKRAREEDAKLKQQQAQPQE
jgi:hypothetical protein